jgi:hypothetical protein
MQSDGLYGTSPHTPDKSASLHQFCKWHSHKLAEKSIYPRKKQNYSVPECPDHEVHCHSVHRDMKIHGELQYRLNCGQDDNFSHNNYNNNASEKRHMSNINKLDMCSHVRILLGKSQGYRVPRGAFQPVDSIHVQLFSINK